MTSGSAAGFLAFAGKEPVGWLSAGPRRDFSKLDRAPATLPQAQVTESRAFLQWLAKDHLTLLGYRQHDLVTEGGAEGGRLGGQVGRVAGKRVGEEAIREIRPRGSS